MNYVDVLTNEAKGSHGFIKETIQNMSREFDFYIRASQVKDVPWWYNERAVLGFFISGLLRNKNNFVLQEYSCDKGKEAKNSGRADLLFTYKGKNYLTEAKFTWTSIKTKGTLDDAKQWAREVLNQAKEYSFNDKRVPKPNIFSLCFEVIYCTNQDYDDAKHYRALLKKWQEGKDALNYLDFYALIGLKRDNTKKIDFGHSETDKWCYPAIAVYGLFNK
jgi:hypothetical protein